MRRSRLPVIAALAAAALFALGSGPARAALFDDEEARKAIVELRERVRQNDDASKARQAELVQANAQLAQQIDQLRRSLLDLNNQLESLRGDLAKLRGSDEQLARDVAELQRRQRDVGQT
ncbi:MAG: tol-pal system protein YbgF, partial [Comamonadaceae bacterium]|nr:tol-pal system protein YbgF [Comamonadaceae bacterium]